MTDCEAAARLLRLSHDFPRARRGALLAAVVACMAGTASAQPPLPPTVAPDAKLVEVYADAKFFEGPTWDPATGKLYFTAFAQDSSQILRLDAPAKAAVWMDKTEGINGTFLSLDGRLLGAQAYGHRVVSYAIGPDGPLDPKVLFFDASLHQPNDLCQSPNGDIYFTDPDFAEHRTSAVFRLAPDGKTAKVITDMDAPNGIMAANDGKTLYVGDSHRKHWRSYPILPDGGVGPGRVFFEPDTENRNDPDGMSIDADGNLYFAGRGGVWAVSPEGKALGLIPVPEFCSNVTFGGADRKTLYLTCDKKLYSLQMVVAGGRAK